MTRLPGNEPRREERLGYDDEPRANHAGTVALRDDGRMLDGEAVVAREVLPAVSQRIRLKTPF